MSWELDWKLGKIKPHRAVHSLRQLIGISESHLDPLLVPLEHLQRDPLL